jgi:hypothetical protein
VGNYEKANKVGGRPEDWDWKAVFIYLIGLAQTDGLFADSKKRSETQAHIERLIADWFVEQGDGCPAVSTVRPFARRIMDSIQSSKNTDK